MTTYGTATTVWREDEAERAADQADAGEEVEHPDRDDHARDDDRREHEGEHQRPCRACCCAPAGRPPACRSASRAARRRAPTNSERSTACVHSGEANTSSYQCSVKLCGGQFRPPLAERQRDHQEGRQADDEEQRPDERREPAATEHRLALFAAAWREREQRVE